VASLKNLQAIAARYQGRIYKIRHAHTNKEHDT
jgi:hypothetical protein